MKKRAAAHHAEICVEQNIASSHSSELTCFETNGLVATAGIAPSKGKGSFSHLGDLHNKSVRILLLFQSCSGGRGLRYLNPSTFGGKEKGGTQSRSVRYFLTRCFIDARIDLSSERQPTPTQPNRHQKDGSRQLLRF